MRRSSVLGSAVVVSSHATWTTPPPASHRLYPASRARRSAALASVGLGSSTRTVSKNTPPPVRRP